MEALNSILLVALGIASLGYVLILAGSIFRLGYHAGIVFGFVLCAITLAICGGLVRASYAGNLCILLAACGVAALAGLIVHAIRRSLDQYRGIVLVLSVVIAFVAGGIFWNSKVLQGGVDSKSTAPMVEK